VARSEGQPDETVIVGPYADLPLDPLSDHYGLGRGTPLDRRYIEAFLAAHHEAIRGSVLEVQDDTYTTTFGADRVSTSTVVDIDDANPARHAHRRPLRAGLAARRRLRLHHPHPDPASAPTPRTVRRQLLPRATTRRHAAGNGPLAQPRQPDLPPWRLLAVHAGRTRRAVRITLAGDVLDPRLRQPAHLHRLPPRPGRGGDPRGRARPQRPPLSAHRGRQRPQAHALTTVSQPRGTTPSRAAPQPGVGGHLRREVTWRVM
jgi:hypothetical protein